MRGSLGPMGAALGPRLRWCPCDEASTKASWTGASDALCFPRIGGTPPSLVSFLDPASLLDRRLLLFTGKGGVGKSTVVAALAVELGRRGRRPLIVELGHRHTMKSMFGVSALGYEPAPVGRGVHAMQLEFEGALTDYMNEHVKVPRLARRVLANQALRRFFEAAPAVAEIATLNKLSALERERRGSAPSWDPILVDLDATGHALMLLNLAKVMDGLVGDGPLRRLLDDFSVLLNDSRKTMLNLVTLPRDLPAQETVELYEKLCSEHRIARGALFINQIPSLHIDDEALTYLDPLQDRAESVDDVELSRDVEITRRMLMVRARAQGQVSRLETSIEMPVVTLAQQVSSHLSLDDVAALGADAVAQLEAGGA